MHIVLGVLGAIITILILLKRLNQGGIDIGWLNPFAWKRRRKWANKYHANPIFAMHSPMEVTALLMLALAKSDGEMTIELKQEIKSKFKEVFHLSDDKASMLMTSSSFLLKDGVEVIRDMKKLLAPSKVEFTQEQAMSALELIHHIANFDGAANSFQEEIIQAFTNEFQISKTPATEWR
jgi:uncharacterized tellurite resistance protein B-like protein